MPSTLSQVSDVDYTNYTRATRVTVDELEANASLALRDNMSGQSSSFVKTP